MVDVVKGVVNGKEVVCVCVGDGKEVACVGDGKEVVLYRRYDRTTRKSCLCNG